ncbi:MAG: hypothetical protein LBD21_04350 [Tannerellaceae bacterium]|jgi:hypothetical protein|nr:hypothetical protein [Tannerellaceae bacterium]
MNRSIWDAFKLWLLANVILPVCAPPLIVFIIMPIGLGLGAPVGDINPFNPISLFLILVDKGVYSFLGITVLLSLFHDRNAEEVIKGWIAVSWTIYVIYLGIIFINSLEFTDVSQIGIHYRTAFYSFTAFASVFAAVIKIKILNNNNQ